MDTIIKGTVQSHALGQSRKQGQPELMLRVAEENSNHVHYARVSFSDKPIASGANKDKTMRTVSTERFAKILGTEPDIAQVASKLEDLKGKAVQCVIGSYTNPDTGVETDSCDSIIFEGETPPSMDAGDWLKLGATA